MSEPAKNGTQSASPAQSHRDASMRISLDEALAPFEDILRQQLPTVEDILRNADSRRQRKLLAGAAVCVIAAAVLWLDPAYRSETIATAVGERGSWTAPDGSTLELNTTSRLTVALHLRSRRLRLEQGEATFHVMHSPWHGAAPWMERPFTVQAGDVTVRDIGTVFNVRHLGDEVRVTVLEGRVRISRPEGGERELSAGHWIEASAPSPGEPTTTDTSLATAWRKGRLVLDDTSLVKAVAEMQRYRTAPIVLEGTQLGSLRISGQFDLDRIDQLIDLLPTLAPVQIHRHADGSVRISPRPGG